MIKQSTMKEFYALMALILGFSLYGQNEQNLKPSTRHEISDAINKDSVFVYFEQHLDSLNPEMKTIATIFHKETIENSDKRALWPPGSVFCSSGPTEIVDVVNPKTGKTWMDRNLGAIQAATSSTDTNSFGDLYQWGRRNDGHQCRNSPVTTTLSSIDQPDHGYFINAQPAPHDWRSPQKSKLWKGVNGINNPCPIGYRLPTDKELRLERLSWSSYDAAGALDSPLRLPLAGFRSASGSLNSLGTGGVYWSSTAKGTTSRRMAIDNTASGWGDIIRAGGFTVRCIKN